MHQLLILLEINDAVPLPRFTDHSTPLKEDMSSQETHHQGQFVSFVCSWGNLLRTHIYAWTMGIEKVEDICGNREGIQSILQIFCSVALAWDKDPIQGRHLILLFPVCLCCLLYLSGRMSLIRAIRGHDLTHPPNSPQQHPTHLSPNSLNSPKSNNLSQQRQWQRQSCDIWDTHYNSHNWEPEFMTIFFSW